MKSKHSIPVVSLVVAGLLSLTACEKREEPVASGGPGQDQTAGQTTQATVDDTVLTTKVKSALIADTATSGSNIEVETQNGVVQLSGTVANKDQMERATQIARAQDGVKDVQNNMKLATETASVGTSIDDTVVTTKVKSALLADPTVKGMDIAVETRNGVVQLSGFVESEQQATRAVEVARSVEGVQEVANEMSVKQK